MIQKVNERCPGDCASCGIAQSLPNFDYTFCMTYQMFKTIQRMSAEVVEIKKVVGLDKVRAAVSLDTESSQVFNDLNENKE